MVRITKVPRMADCSPVCSLEHENTMQLYPG